MQSEIFNYVNTGAYVKQVTLILFETLKETWHIQNAYGVCKHHRLEFKVNIHSLPYIWKQPIITEIADRQFP